MNVYDIVCMYESQSAGCGYFYDSQRPAYKLFLLKSVRWIDVDLRRFVGDSMESSLHIRCCDTTRHSRCDGGYWRPQLLFPYGSVLMIHGSEFTHVTLFQFI